MFNEAHVGRVMPLDLANVDTDQIIPKQFLMSVKRTGYAENMFYDWRFNEDGSLKQDFVMNDPKYKGASILLARDNFGCGSSREHAVWALEEAGLTIILSTSFADIFYNNAINNGLLPIVLAEPEIDRLFQMVQSDPKLECTIDLEHQTIAIEGKQTIKFPIKAEDKVRIIENADLVTSANKYRKEVEAFEENLKLVNPWL